LSFSRRICFSLAIQIATRAAGSANSSDAFGNRIWFCLWSARLSFCSDLRKWLRQIKSPEIFKYLAIAESAWWSSLPGGCSSFMHFMESTAKDMALEQQWYGWSVNQPRKSTMRCWLFKKKAHQIRRLEQQLSCQLTNMVPRLGLCQKTRKSSWIANYYEALPQGWDKPRISFFRILPLTRSSWNPPKFDLTCSLEINYQNLL